jgi:FAD synthetase
MADEIRNRVMKYIKGMRERLANVNVQDEKLRRIVDLARQYTEDSEYYLSKGDEVTALVDIVYAEGLLDSVLLLTGQDTKSDVGKKVFVGGTFDLLHPGHIEFLKEAARLGRVYVSVSRDKNAERIKKRKIVMNERERLEILNSIRYVYEAFLGDENDFLNSVLKVRPDIIFLGPDQKVDEEKLREELRKRGLDNVEIVRMKERLNSWNHSSSSKIIADIVEKFCEKGEMKGKEAQT